MIKTVCDICGKEVETIPSYIKNVEVFRISSNGRIWDICDDCRVDFSKWVEQRKVRQEINEV